MNLSGPEKKRYSRHLMLDAIGEEGQLKLKAARVLVVGAGGLGCPALQYISSAGVGTIGIMDFDVVEASNLQRQVLFTEADIGKFKASCAAERLKASNPYITITAINEKLTARNIRNVFNEFDVIIDGSDNFTTRYLINDGCVLLNKPFVFGSLYKFSGQVSVFNFVSANGSHGPTYRSVFPEAPVAGAVANCSEVGVLGAVAGIIGTIQATEAIKVIVGNPEGLSGYLLMVDGLSMTFSKWAIPATSVRDSNTPKSWEELHAFDYEYFCNAHPMKLTITPADLEKLLPLEKVIQIIDVREEWESEETPFLNAIRIPLHVLSESSEQLNPLVKTVVVCQNGKRSQLAINILSDRGFADAYSLEGGISHWETQKANVKS